MYLPGKGKYNMVVMIHPKCITSKFLLQLGLITGATIAVLIAVALLVWLYLQLACSIMLTVANYADHADLVTRTLLFILLTIGLYQFGKYGNRAVRSVFKVRAGHEY